MGKLQYLQQIDVESGSTGYRSLNPSPGRIEAVETSNNGEHAKLNSPGTVLDASPNVLHVCCELDPSPPTILETCNA